MHNSQYQWEVARYFASYLKDFQWIPLEFDIDEPLEESDLIKFFRKSFKPSIKTEIEQKSQELNTWEEMI